MNRINKLLLIIFLILIIILSSACVFPDNMPELQNLKKYSPQKIEYGQTTLKEFKKLFSKINDSDLEVYTGGITIMKLKPSVKDVYSSIRVGFKNNKLDWIEFNLAHNIKISRFVSIYGNSTDINATDNQDLDYYNLF